MKPNILYRFAGWFSGTPAEQLACRHPLYARDYRLEFIITEQEGKDYYETCLNCGKEWHEKGVKK